MEHKYEQVQAMYEDELSVMLDRKEKIDEEYTHYDKNV